MFPKVPIHITIQRTGEFPLGHFYRIPEKECDVDLILTMILYEKWMVYLTKPKANTTDHYLSTHATAIALFCLVRRRRCLIDRMNGLKDELKSAIRLDIYHQLGVGQILGLHNPRIVIRAVLVVWGHGNILATWIKEYRICHENHLHTCVSNSID